MSDSNIIPTENPWKILRVTLVQCVIVARRLAGMVLHVNGHSGCVPWCRDLHACFHSNTRERAASPVQVIDPIAVSFQTNPSHLQRSFKKQGFYKGITAVKQCKENIERAGTKRISESCISGSSAFVTTAPLWHTDPFTVLFSLGFELVVARRCSCTRCQINNLYQEFFSLREHKLSLIYCLNSRGVKYVSVLCELIHSKIFSCFSSVFNQTCHLAKTAVRQALDY